MGRPVLIVNAGSSSIKFAAFDPVAFPGKLSVIGKGHVAQLGAEGRWSCPELADGTVLEHSSAALGTWRLRS